MVVKKNRCMRDVGVLDNLMLNGDENVKLNIWSFGNVRERREK